MLRAIRRSSEGPGESQALAPAPAADELSLRQLKGLLRNFLATDLGLEWLAEVVDDWDARLSALRAPPGSIGELNAYVMSSFKDFVRSETGQKLSARIDSEVNRGTLMVPAYLVEQLIKMRLKHSVLVYGRPMVVATAWQVALCCGVIHVAKRAARHATRRWRRPHRVVCFVTKVMMPTHVMGALWGLFNTLGKMHQALTQD